MNRYLCCTLVQIFDHKRILLGLKKRGLGVGKWNGFGGKVKPGEEIKMAAVRELKEESGLDVETSDLTNVGKLVFEFVNNGLVIEVYVFRAQNYHGEIVETEEMKPQWFSIDEIPFNEMWVDDIDWYPFMFTQKLFFGFMKFNGENEMLYKELQVVENV
uniref:Oxidized purine nucleoside triphosphate hydrolase n=1 Tax=Ciona savignyi TaxID=51511 RepID=H2YYG2_CIOSA